MGKIKAPVIDWRSGLNTSAPDESHDLVWRTFQDFRSDSGAARRRLGCYRISRSASVDTILVFDGSNDRVTFPYNANQFGFHIFPVWTIEWVSQCTSLAATRTVLAKGTNLVITQDSTSSGRVVATVVDAGAATTTLVVTSIASNTLIDGRLIWNGTTLTLSVNGTSDTQTPTNATLATDTNSLVVGANSAAANHFVGNIERVSAFTSVKNRTHDCRSRLVNPRAPSCVFDCNFNTTDFARDRSRFEAIGTVNGSPATTATLLTNNPLPIQAIAGAQSNQGTRQGYYVGAGAVYPFVVT